MTDKQATVAALEGFAAAVGLDIRGLLDPEEFGWTSNDTATITEAIGRLNKGLAVIANEHGLLEERQYNTDGQPTVVIDSLVTHIFGWVRVMDIAALDPESPLDEDLIAQISGTCPGCDQPITTDGFGRTECGGEGEGVCSVVVYAEDRRRDPVAAAKNWSDVNGAAPVPSAELCLETLAAHAGRARG